VRNIRSEDKCVKGKEDEQKVAMLKNDEANDGMGQSGNKGNHMSCK